MNRIHIEGNYFISGTAMDFTLELDGVTTKGENIGAKTTTNLGYFPSISSCMKALLKLKIMDTTATDLKGLIADVARIETNLKELINF